MQGMLQPLTARFGAVTLSTRCKSSSIVRERARLRRDNYHLLLTKGLLSLASFPSLPISLFSIGSEILGHPMIVEPSHQQRLSSRCVQTQNLYFDSARLCARALFVYALACLLATLARRLVALFFNSVDLRAAVQGCHFSDILLDCYNFGLPSRSG